jgi:hypothetical protein
MTSVTRPKYALEAVSRRVQNVPKFSPTKPLPRGFLTQPVTLNYLNCQRPMRDIKRTKVGKKGEVYILSAIYFSIAF